MTRGTPPPNPPLRFAPTRWYFADTPTALTPSGGPPPWTPRYPLRYRPYHRPLTRAVGPGSLGRYGRLAVGRRG